MFSRILDFLLSCLLGFRVSWFLGFKDSKNLHVWEEIWPILPNFHLLFKLVDIDLNPRLSRFHSKDCRDFLVPTFSNIGGGLRPPPLCGILCGYVAMWLCDYVAM